MKDETGGFMNCMGNLNKSKEKEVWKNDCRSVHQVEVRKGIKFPQKAAPPPHPPDVTEDVEATRM